VLLKSIKKSGTAIPPEVDQMVREVLRIAPDDSH